jgi:alginate O-acetyltransferase complex protein AlgJ
MTPARFTALAFLAILYVVPLSQAAWDLSKGERVQALDVIGAPSEARLRKFEDDLHDASFVYQRLTPWYQLGLIEGLHRGNEKILLGDDGWLYYTDDLAFVVHGTFLDLEDADGNTVVGGIAAFRDELATQGVELLLLPVPIKTQADPRYVSRFSRDVRAADNAEMPAFLSALEAAGVETLDLTADFEAIRTELGADAPMFMPRDTHWTPQTMERVAARVARRVEALVGERLTRRTEWRGERTRITSDGDMPSLLTGPEGVRLFPAMELDVRRVLGPDGELFEPDAGAEVLVLGDSFTGVFSIEKLGVGTGAGFAEQLAFELGRPVDSITIAGGAVLAAREALARRAAPLAGKTIVVWEIGARELMGDVSRWRPVDLSGRTSDGPDTRPAPDAGPIVVDARVTEVSRVPDGFAYALCLVVHELELLEVVSGSVPDGPLWVAFPGMVDFDLVDGNTLTVGQRLRLTLEPIELHHDLEETAWIDDVGAGFDIFWAVESR